MAYKSVEEQRHEAILAVLTTIAEGIIYMADAQTQALADLTSAVTSLADAIAEMALKQVLKGDLGWFREIVARAEGAVAQTVNLTTSAKAPTPEEAAAAIEASYRAEERERLDATDS